MNWLHPGGLRGAEEKFLFGAAMANLLLLARPDARSAWTRRPPRSRNGSTIWLGSAEAGSSNFTTRRYSEAGSVDLALGGREVAIEGRTADL